MHGSTPMDTALAILDKFRISDLFIPHEVKEENHSISFIQKEENLNPTIAGILFSCVSEYEYNHSGVFLADAIVKAIKEEVPGIGDYL